MKHLLVASATGYLGGYVALEFKARGHFVRALARAPEKLERLNTDLDDIVQAEITRPETLERACNGIDIVFSSIGITKQKDGLTFRDVDYQGNRNLLEAAQRCGVQKFIYVSVFKGPELRHLDIVAAHEDFVDELRISGINFTVLRPTGYFSDVGEFFKMARKGRVWLIGSGTNRVNPIHGADLAVACANAVDGDNSEIDIGGPQTLTWKEVAALAFRVLERPARINRIPAWLMWWAVRVVRLINRHQGELLAFFTTMGTTDVVAPRFSRHLLEAHYRSLQGQE
jgi:uncharacterized protein YbjT (DUF2867 family)